MRHLWTILCVDRYEGILTTLPPVLQQLGYRVLTASSARDAVAGAKAAHPDVVLLDFHLCPGCPENPNRPCLARDLKDVAPQARIVVWCDDGTSMRHPPPCAVATFMKPIPPAELDARLQALNEPQAKRLQS